MAPCGGLSLKSKVTTSVPTDVLAPVFISPSNNVAGPLALIVAPGANIALSLQT